MMNGEELYRFKQSVKEELERAKKLATREFTKVEPELTDTLSAVEEYVKKHPRQATLISLSLGAAIGAAGAFSLSRRRSRIK